MIIIFMSTSQFDFVKGSEVNINRMKFPKSCKVLPLCVIITHTKKMTNVPTATAAKNEIF